MPVPIDFCNCVDCVEFRHRQSELAASGDLGGYAGTDENGQLYVLCGGDLPCYGCNPENMCVSDFGDPMEDEEDSFQDDEASQEVEFVSIEDSSPALIRPTNLSSLFLPILPDRPIRLMSFEQEIGVGSRRSEVVHHFYENKYSPYEEVLGYGSSYDVWREHRRSKTFAHVEYDSSCGGEIIYSMLDLSDDEIAHRFENANSDIRQMIRDEKVRLDMHCGFHIHVGLGFDEVRNIPAFSMNAVENLYHAHNYLEDFLYRIGAAKWSAHRTEVNDTDYSQVVPKGYKGKVAIGTGIRRDRYALNLSNYLRARGDCNCGAFQFAAWEECTCRLEKPTVEFRWPNATANPRKIHAFSSLLQGLISRCATAEAGEFANLPAQEFLGTRRGIFPSTDSIMDRIDWIGKNISQTKEERMSLAYCMGDHFGYDTNIFTYAIQTLPYEKHELVRI